MAMMQEIENLQRGRLWSSLLKLCRRKLSLLFGLSRDHDHFGDLAGNTGRTRKHCCPGKPRRSTPTRESKQIEGVGCSSFIVALFRRVMVAEFAENDGARGGAFSGRTRFPVEAEALTTNRTVNVLPELGSSK
jgi:hypothetical protein